MGNNEGICNMSHEVVYGNTLYVTFGVICTFLFVLTFFYTIRAVIDEQHKDEFKLLSIISALFAAGIYYASTSVFGI
jgi:hypothetical protein